MPNILFSSNNLTHFEGIGVSYDVNHFDDTRVPYAMGIIKNNLFTSRVFEPSTTGTTYLHMRVWPTENTRTAESAFVNLYDVDGNLLLSWRKGTNDTFQLTLHDNGSSVVGNTSSVLFNVSAMTNFDVRFTQTAFEITAEAFIAGLSVCSCTINSNLSDFGQPAYFTVSGEMGQDNDDTVYISEIIVADGSTLNARLNLLNVTAVGAFDEWTGLATNLADDDNTTGMTALTAGLRQTLTLSAYTGASNISNIVLVSNTIKGLNAPTQLSHTFRYSGVNYDGTPILLDDTLKYSVSDFAINPATSLPWVSSDLTGLEVGFLSVA